MSEKNEFEKFKKKYEKLMAAHEGLKSRIKLNKGNVHVTFDFL